MECKKLAPGQYELRHRGRAATIAVDERFLWNIVAGDGPPERVGYKSKRSLKDAFETWAANSTAPPPTRRRLPPDALGGDAPPAAPPRYAVVQSEYGAVYLDTLWDEREPAEAHARALAESMDTGETVLLYECPRGIPHRKIILRLHGGAK